MWGWLFNLFYGRSNREVTAEVDRLCADNARLCADLNARLREVYTKDEWNALDARIRREHPDLF